MLAVLAVDGDEPAAALDEAEARGVFVRDGGDVRSGTPCSGPQPSDGRRLPSGGLRTGR